MESKALPPVPTNAPPPDLLAIAEKDPLVALKALGIVQASLAFRHPTRNRHARLSGTSAQVLDDPKKDKKRRKVAEARQKASHKHASKKKRPTGSKRRK